MTLLMDLGTNGEIVLGNKDRIICCSTAAGPAFEGARITHGMRASNGAIERVFIKESGIEINTIGNEKAIGLCGSGLIDAVAELLKMEVLGRDGKFNKRVNLQEISKNCLENPRLFDVDTFRNEQFI